MVRRFLWVLLLASGCTFDGAGIGPVDGVPTADRVASDLGGVIDLRADVSWETALDLRVVDGTNRDGADGADVDTVQDWAVWDESVPPDQGVPDQGVPDQGVPDQGVPDQRVPDQRVPDQRVPDQRVPDKSIPDHASPDLTRPPCATTYGRVSGFKPCDQTATECTFFFTSGTCNAKCQAFGGTCIRAAADKDDTCTELYAVLCSANQNDGLCTCTR